MSKQHFFFKGYDFLGAPDVTGLQTTYMASLAVITPLMADDFSKNTIDSL